jgi:hypothetical protein
MQFEDATDHLAGAFSFHFEAEKKRVGIFSDLTFVRLSTEADFTLEGATPVVVNGDAEIRDTFFEAGTSYRLSDSHNVAVIGGLRVFTVGAQVEFNTVNVSLSPIDGDRTAVSVFGGLTYRPALGSKATLVSRADIGGGSGMSWAAELGLEWRPAPWAGLVFGYRAIGVSLGNETDDHDIRQADLTFYGPVFGLNLHWGGRP